MFPLQKSPFQFRLDLRVGDPGALFLRVHVSVDTVIQAEVAGNSHEIRDHLIPLIPGLRLAHQHAAPLHELRSRFAVHSHAFLVHLVLSKCLIKKQDIRPVNSQKEAVPLLLYDPLDDRVRLHIYFSPVKIMRKCCRHETHLLCDIRCTAGTALSCSRFQILPCNGKSCDKMDRHSFINPYLFDL